MFYRSAGEKFRQEVLIHGGGKPPRQMVGEFLGKEITADSLVEAYMLDLEQKSHLVKTVIGSWKYPFNLKLNSLLCAGNLTF